jgi:chorismate dehydratase
MQPLRVATVPYVNAAPLIRGLGTIASGRTVVLVRESPALIAALIKERRVDVGLVPAIEYLRLEDAVLVPGPCIASKRRARSVLLVSRRPIDAIRRVALDRNSRTSAALLRIVLAHRRVSGVAFEEMPPSLPEMLREHDAALLIGDAALAADTAGHLVLDLAEEWFQMTGLPFVFAVWAAPAGALRSADVGLLEESRRTGLSQIDAIAAEESDRLGLPATTIAEYLRVNIHYDLGPEEVRGLELFFRRAQDLRLAEACRPLRFQPVPEPDHAERIAT